MMTEHNDNQLLFGGGKESRAEAIYARYAMGDPMNQIVKDTGLSSQQIRNIMRKQPEKYDQSKQQREAFTGLRLRRQLALVDAWNLRLLENLTEGKFDSTPEIMKHISKLVRDLSHRVQLLDNKPTDIVRDDRIMDIETVEARIKAIKDAGDGLAIE